jgi:hypothetical protein
VDNAVFWGAAPHPQKTAFFIVTAVKTSNLTSVWIMTHPVRIWLSFLSGQIL